MSKFNKYFFVVIIISIVILPLAGKGFEKITHKKILNISLVGYTDAIAKPDFDLKEYINGNFQKMNNTVYHRVI